jgi:hypothetical protein
LLEQVCATLKAVANIEAIALGGSHARGTQRPSSDLDIGLYYREAAPFDIADIARVARAFAPGGEPTVTGFYEWGPFVNGGAWIENPVCKIDFLYRNLDQLAREIAAAQKGNWSHSFDQQPPFGFRSVTVLGEIRCCKPLADPSGALARLKDEVAVYPPRLKQRIIQDTLWCAEFSFLFADDFARSGDVPNTAGCMTRIFHYLVQALFAINEIYFMNDKYVQQQIETFRRCPDDFVSRMGVILGHAGSTAAQLDASLRTLQLLFLETVRLAEGNYAPRFAPPKKAPDQL